MTVATRHNRRLPFLHRNWIKVTNHWNEKMVIKTTSRRPRDSGDKFAAEEEQCQHPSKRRRVKQENDYDGAPFLAGDAPRSLRLEILKISHKDSPRLKNGIMNGVVPPVVTQMRARCRITICTVKGGEQIVLHVDSQLCDIKIYKNPTGSSPLARVVDIKPFTIPEDKIYLERDDDAVFGLARSYTVFVELESAGDPKWPPIDLVSLSDQDAFCTLPARQWVLSANIPDIFNSRHRKTIRIRVKNQPQQENLTNFIMDVDVRWLTSISSQSREHQKDIKSSITVFDPFEPVMPLISGNPNGIDVVGAFVTPESTNGINGHHPLPLVNGEIDRLIDAHANGIVVEHPDELAEGEVTPTRSRRARPDINYNVKHLWNKASKKESKKPRKSNDEQGHMDDHVITYILPPEQVQTDRLSCLVCGAENDRINQLRVHYGSHPQYAFDIGMGPRGGYVITVTPSLNNTDDPLRPKVYQLGLPVKPLDLDKYAEGDYSWVHSRLGPDNGVEIGQKPQQIKPLQKRPVQRTQKKVYVPNIKQPLFDPLSKVQLVPGTEVRQHPVDDGWLLDKHRDNLQDFLDVTPAEKEYMKEWDAFILKKHLSSEQYLPRELLKFVKEKAPWIVARRSRAEEFSKHISMLLARQVVSDANIVEVTQRLNEARALKLPEEEKLAPTPRRAGGCTACGEPVPVPSMLICANKQCKKRLYHDTCVENPQEAVEKGRDWLCSSCS
ncbi:hypothetical protein B0T22DRAFT_257500 [Podospora appendiculata]|uniref:Zinc finger PHD-type domain-containing protein n=1 Tax=Podospora appendiculata TaxID=314037 RepID=A0AAE0X2V9_9PEZI|nr:hypothetical protein B0T22DRAFT_257500 [Podospora appendiculata]